jgi:hypothetical protein
MEPKSYTDVELKTYTECTPKELWEHEQSNFSAHIAIMFQYLEAHGLAVNDFIRYTGEKVLPSWKRRGDTPEIMMNGILRNVLANGGSVLHVTIGERLAEATVTSLLRLDVTEQYGITPDLAQRFWDKFIPIADALGMRFTWKRTEAGHDHIQLVRVA